MVIFHSYVKVYQRVSLTIVDHSYKMVIFHSYVKVYQRLMGSSSQPFPSFPIRPVRSRACAPGDGSALSDRSGESLGGDPWKIYGTFKTDGTYLENSWILKWNIYIYIYIYIHIHIQTHIYIYAPKDGTFKIDN